MFFVSVSFSEVCELAKVGKHFCAASENLKEREYYSNTTFDIKGYLIFV
jgi:hypothetical protein